MNPAPPAPRVTTEKVERYLRANMMTGGGQSTECRMAADLIDAREQLANQKPPTHTITLTRRATDWHACVDGDRSMWAVGETRGSAIGSLVLTFRETFGIVVQEPG